MALVTDTGPLYAVLDLRDADHVSCRELVRSTRESLVIPAPVLVEVDYLLQSRGRAEGMLGLLDDISAGIFRVELLILADYRRVRELCAQYADSDIGIVDAAMLAVVERLNEPKPATLDHRRFGMLRPRHVNALRLLPE